MPPELVEPTRARPSCTRTRRSRFARFAGALLFVIVAVMPFVSLAVEFWLRISTNYYFNPVPSHAHVALVSLVPIASFATWSSARATSIHAVPAWIGALHGVALAVSLIYFLAYVRFTLHAIIAIAFWGFGFVALEPVVCFPVLAVLAWRLMRNSSERGRTCLAMAAGAALALITFYFAEQAAIANGTCSVFEGVRRAFEHSGVG